MINSKIAPNWLLIVAIQFIVLSAVAQNGNLPYYNYYSAYSQQRRDVAEANRAMADRMNQPNSPGGSYKPLAFTKEEEEKINAQWNAIFHPVKKVITYTAEEQAKRDKDKAMYYKEQSDLDKTKSDFIEEYQTKYKNMLTYFGFHKMEAKHIYENEIYEKTYSNIEIKKGIKDRALVFENINENLNTANFEVIEKGITDLIDINAPYSALKFADILQQRFPGKVVEIDKIRIKALDNFFMFYNREQDINFMGTWKHAYDFGIFFKETYMSMEDKYPEIYKNFRIKPSPFNCHHPYILLYRLYSDYSENTRIINAREDKMKKIFGDLRDSLLANEELYDAKTHTIQGVKELALSRKVKTSDIVQKKVDPPTDFAVYMALANEGDDDALIKAYNIWKEMSNDNISGRYYYKNKEMGYFTYNKWIDYLVQKSQNDNGSIAVVKIILSDNDFHNGIVVKGKMYEKMIAELQNYFNDKYDVDKTVEYFRLIVFPKKREDYLEWDERISFKGAWYFFYSSNKSNYKPFLGIAKYAKQGNARAIEIQAVFDDIEKDPNHKLILF